MGLPGKAEIAEAYPGAKWPVAVDGKKRPKIKPIPYEPARLAPPLDKGEGQGGCPA